MSGGHCSVRNGMRLSHERFTSPVPVLLMKKSSTKDMEIAVKSNNVPGVVEGGGHDGVN